ncbi:MAG: hypothetical protein M3R30_03470 [Candidatus Eremiobacteraeota bacterium]|nr:hypothetical protein [Candidatus Eremiobacteraeota bacterium]
MAYVEWLRVKKTLLVLGIVLAVLFLIAVIVRISVDGKMHADSWASMAASSTHVSSKVLPDGATETTIVEPGSRGKTIVVADHGWDGKHITVTDPKGMFSHSDNMPRDFSIGPTQMHRVDNTTETIDTNGPLDIGMLFAGVTLLGLIIATCLGAPLARENDRLEVAWTKPIDRTMYALQLYATDIVGIVASLVVGVVFCIIAYSLFQAPHLTLTADGAWKIALSIVAGTAWYGMFAAITSWMKRGHGAFLGISWPVGLFVPGLALIPLDFNAVGQVFHWIFQAISYIDPIAYLHLGVGTSGRVLGLAALDEPLKLGILALLALVYLGAGLIEWRRVEA